MLPLHAGSLSDHAVGSISVHAFTVSIMSTQLLALRDEPVFGNADPTPPPDAARLDIKVQPDDAIFGAAPPKESAIPLKEAETATARPAPSVFGRFFRFIRRLLAVVALCGVAWLAGAYYARHHSLAPATLAQDSQPTQSPAHDDLANAVRQMTEELRSLKATAVDDVKNRESQKSQLDSTRTVTGATVAELAGRIDKLTDEFSTKLSQIDTQLASIEQQIAASHSALALRRPVPHKHVAHPHDAFNPAQDPGAPGAPRPLGSW